MTLVLALVAQDGVVLAADGQATSTSGVPTTNSTEKLDVLHDKIAYGCAGSAGMRQKVRAALQEQITPEMCSQSFEELRSKLHPVVNKIQKEAEEAFVSTSPFDKLHTVEVLFGGHSNGEPWVYEVTKSGDDQRHNIFEAIGAARHFASYALNSAEHYELTNRQLPQVRLLAYRAVDDAIRTDATALGQPVQIVQATAEGARRLTEQEMTSLKDSITIWQGHECEIFDAQSGELRSVQPLVAGESGIDAPQG